MYEYKAKITEVYDSDSVTILVDCGFHVYIKEKARLLGIDTPELRTKNKEEKKAGYEARDYLRSLILNKEVIIETEKEGKFGRYLIIIYLNGININKLLIEKGYAVKYYGEKKTPWSKLKFKR